MTFQPPKLLLRLLWPGALLFVLPAALCTYFLMPFHGSQTPDVVVPIYHLSALVPALQVLGLFLMIMPVVHAMISGTLWRRIRVSILVIVCGVVWYFTSFEMTAEDLFHEPVTNSFASGATPAVPLETIVLGISRNGVTKAYPIRFLAFHHKVHDTIGGQPVLVTYCSMCRTGRVYNPVVDGKVQHFRLVGARQYNAMFEDNETKSWWYQATGEAVVGPRTGMHLDELPSEEMTLRAWLAAHPNSLVYQPDAASNEGYRMFGFAKWDSIRPPQGYFDSSQYTWNLRSWVVGVTSGKIAKAYPWSTVMKAGVLNDTVSGTPVVLIAESDSVSFHVWNRTVHDSILTFNIADSTSMTDNETHSLWNWSGTCISGTYAGQRLTPLRAFREYWHSWKTFHPGTNKFSVL